MEGKSRKQLSDNSAVFLRVVNILMQLVWVSQTYTTLLNSEQIPEGWKLSLHFVSSPSLFLGLPSPPKTWTYHSHLDYFKTTWVLFRIWYNSVFMRCNCVWHLAFATPGSNNTHYVQSGKRDFIHPTPVNGVELVHIELTSFQSLPHLISGW